MRDAALCIIPFSFELAQFTHLWPDEGTCMFQMTQFGKWGCDALL